jgi:hypothetical protein
MYDAWRRFDRTHELRHRMIGEAPHLLDPEELDSHSRDDGKQRGFYHIPTSHARSDLSAADFSDSIFEVRTTGCISW